MVFFQHLHIRVIWQAFLAHGRKVRGLPAAPVEVLLDLGWHIGGGLSFLGAGTKDTKSLWLLKGVYSVSGVSEYVVVGAQRDDGEGIVHGQGEI
jgi:hypothetical protein